MKINKVSIALALVFLLSCCTGQNSPASSTTEGQQELSVTEQTSSDYASEIPESIDASAEENIAGEIDLSNFIEITGERHPVVKRTVDGEILHYISYEETGNLQKSCFGYFTRRDSFPEMFGIQIVTENGVSYLGRNGKIEIPTKNSMNEYSLISFMKGDLHEFRKEFDNTERLDLYALDGDIWFYQDDSCITFVSGFFDVQYETTTTNIVRIDLDTQQVIGHGQAANSVVNCMLDGDTLYVLCNSGQIWEDYQGYAFSWQDLSLLSKTDSLYADPALRYSDIPLFIKDGVLYGSYLSEGEEIVIEIMEAID